MVRDPIKEKEEREENRKAAIRAWITTAIFVVIAGLIKHPVYSPVLIVWGIIIATWGFSGWIESLEEKDEIKKYKEIQ